MTRILTMVLTALMLNAADLSAANEHEESVNFTLQRLQGGEVSLSDFRGKWLVLNYWATWCTPCRKEIPDLSALHEARDDIVVLGLAFEDTEMEVFDEFLEEFHPSYPLLQVDVYEPPEPFGAPKALPTTIILNPRGYSVKTFMGPITRQDIESFVDAK